MKVGGRGTCPAQSAGKKFSRRSVQFGHSLLFAVHGAIYESAPLFVAMLWVAMMSLTHATRGYGLPHTLVLCFNPLPPIFFFENLSDLHQSQDWHWHRLGGGSCPHLPPPPVTTLMRPVPKLVVSCSATAFLYLSCNNALLIFRSVKCMTACCQARSACDSDTLSLSSVHLMIFSLIQLKFPNDCLLILAFLAVLIHIEVALYDRL